MKEKMELYIFTSICIIIAVLPIYIFIYNENSFLGLKHFYVKQHNITNEINQNLSTKYKDTIDINRDSIVGSYIDNKSNPADKNNQIPILIFSDSQQHLIDEFQKLQNNKDIIINGIAYIEDNKMKMKYLSKDKNFALVVIIGLYKYEMRKMLLDLFPNIPTDRIVPLNLFKMNGFNILDDSLLSSINIPNIIKIIMHINIKFDGIIIM